MFDSMRVTQQITPKNRSIIKRKQDEEANKQALETESESNNANLAQSRGLKYVENLQNGNNSSSSNNLKTNNYAYNSQINSAQVQNRGIRRPLAKANNNVPVNETEAQKTSREFMATHSPKINIAQVIGDFKNTAAAIGTPEDVADEVNAYLDLVEKQTKKDSTNVKMVQSNLRNAANLLDGYISATLNKNSKVVENWVEAIFLQQVDYKYNKEDINEAFLVQMPDDKKKSTSADDKTAQVQINAEQTPKIDLQLRNLFSAAKKITKAGNNDLALSTYQKAINRSIEVKDADTQSKLCFEVGKIYDKSDKLDLALENYNKSIEVATDDNIKVQAHYAMAQIYDDVNQFKPAIEHYMAAISFAGEAENFKAQTKSLTKIGNIYTDKYDKEAFNAYQVAEDVADETKDAKVKGYVSSTIASAYDKFNKPIEALKYYSNAAKNYVEAGENEKVAINYKKAGNLMSDYNRGDKGKILIQKALMYAKKANNQTLVKELNSELVA